MPRSASDATRFTATGPYAAAKPTPGFNSSLPISQPGSPNENAAQKIARLRAAAAQARLGKESRFDRVVRVGRPWVDRAHRATSLSLIGLTLISGVIASFAIGDMLLHNRRKRNEWLADQQQKSAYLLAQAKEAAASGIADEDQILLLNRERAAEEAVAAKKARKGIFSRAKDAVFGGVSEEEERGGRIGAAARAAQEQVHEVMPQSKEGLGIVQAVEEHRRAGEKVEKVLHPLGGPLDREAEARVETAMAKSEGWSSWLTGR